MDFTKCGDEAKLLFPPRVCLCCVCVCWCYVDLVIPGGIVELMVLYEVSGMTRK